MIIDPKKSSPKRIMAVLIVFLLLFILVFSGLVSYRLISGRSLGLKSLARNTIDYLSNMSSAVFKRGVINRSEKFNFDDIIFLHHSTGGNLIEQGDVRERFTQAGYEFWDHGFNKQGLTNPNGEGAGFNFFVPRDNTDPDGLAEIFSQPAFGLPFNTLSALLQYDVIAFKSCFAPANNISSDAQLEQYKQWYLGIRNTLSKHADKIFIVVTYPPLNPAETNPDEAARARSFTNWLLSNEFLAGISNIYTFDFYTLLAENNPKAPDFGMLRSDYREGTDSHPNSLANETIGPLFVEFVIKSIEDFKLKTSSE